MTPTDFSEDTLIYMVARERFKRPFPCAGGNSGFQLIVKTYFAVFSLINEVLLPDMLELLRQQWGL